MGPWVTSEDHRRAGGLDLAAGGGADDGIGRGDLHLQTRQRSADCIAAGDIEVRLEPEARAAGARRGQADGPVMGGGQTADDGQAQACAFQPGRRAGYLGVFLKDAGLFRLGNAGAGVGHRQAQLDRPVGLERTAGLHQHSAGLSKLDGVARQVEQDLPQTALVGHHTGRRTGHGPGDLQTFFVGARAEQLAHPLQQALHVHRRGFQVDLAAFQLGQVEHVIDQAQQVGAGVLQGLDIGALVGV